MKTRTRIIGSLALALVISLVAFPQTLQPHGQQLIWNGPAIGIVDGYNIYFAPAGNTTFTKINSSLVTATTNNCTQPPGSPTFPVGVIITAPCFTYFDTANFSSGSKGQYNITSSLAGVESAPLGPVQTTNVIVPPGPTGCASQAK